MASANLGVESFPSSKPEQWKGIQVTINIPCEAALRLKELSVHGEVMNELGILSVHIEDQVSSLSLSNLLGDPQEIAPKTSETRNLNASIINSFDSSETSCSFGPSSVETTRKNIAHYLSQQGNNLISSPITSASLGGAGSPFVPPKVSSADIPNGFHKTVLDSDHHTKLHHSSPVVPTNREPEVVQSPMFSHLPHNHMDRPCSPQINFSPFVGLNQVINTKYASTHHQPVVQAHGYSSRFNFSPPHPQMSSREFTISCLEQSSYVNDRTDLSPSLHAPELQKACSLNNRSSNIPFSSFCPQISTQNPVVPMSTSSQGNVALSSPMLVNLLKSEAVNNASKMMPPPLLPSKQLQKKRRRARKSKDMPHTNMFVSPSVSFRPFDTSPGLCTSKPSISEVHTSLSSPDLDTFSILNSEAYHHPLPRIPFSTSSSLSQTSKIHPWTEEHSQVPDIKLPHQKQIPLEVSQFIKLPSSIALSNNETSPYSSALDSNKDNLILSKSESSLCCPEKNQIYNTNNNPFSSPPPPLTDTKTKHLINPFTGQLEPMLSEDDEDYPLNSSDLYADFQIDVANSTCLDKNVMNVCNSLPGKRIEAKTCYAFQKSSKLQNSELSRTAEADGFSDSRTKKYLISGHSPITSTFLINNDPDERLKVPLKRYSKTAMDFISEKSEKPLVALNPYSSQNVDGIEMNIEDQKKSSKTAEYSSEDMHTYMQRRHLLLKDNHECVVKHPNKNHIRKRAFDSTNKLFNSFKHSDTLVTDSQIEKNISENYISQNLFSPWLSPSHDVCLKDDSSCSDQNWYHDVKTPFNAPACNSGLNFSPTKDMQNTEFSRSFDVVSTSSVSSETLNNFNSNVNSTVDFAISQEICKPNLSSLLHNHDKYKINDNDVPPLCVQKSVEMKQGICSVQSEISTATPLTSDILLSTIENETVDNQSQQTTHNVLPQDTHPSCFSDCVMEDCVKYEKDNSASQTVFTKLESSVCGKNVNKETEISNISIRNLCSKVHPKELICEGGSHNVTPATQDMQDISSLPHVLVEKPLQSSTEDGTSFELQEGCNSSSPKSVNSIPSVLCDTPDSYPTLTCSLTEHDVLPSVASDTNETIVHKEANHEDEAKESDASSPINDNEIITSQHHFETPPDSRSPVSLSVVLNDIGVNEEINSLDLVKKPLAVPKNIPDNDDGENCCKNINKALKNLTFHSEDSCNVNICTFNLPKSEKVAENIKINHSSSLSVPNFQHRTSSLEPKHANHIINNSRIKGVKKETSTVSIVENKSNESLNVNNAKPSCSDELNDISTVLDNMNNSFHMKNAKHSAPVASQRNLNEKMNPKAEMHCHHQIEDDISIDIKDIDLFQDCKKIKISEEIKSPVAKIISLPLQKIPHLIEVPSLHVSQNVPKIKCAKIESSSFETSSIPSLIPSHGNSFSKMSVETHQYRQKHQLLEPVTIHSRFISSQTTLDPLSPVKVNLCNAISNSEKEKLLSDRDNNTKIEVRGCSSVKQECDSTISSDESSLDSLDNFNESNPFPLTTCNEENSLLMKRPNSECSKLPCYGKTGLGMQNEKNIKSLINLSESEVSSNVMCEKELSLSKNTTEVSGTNLTLQPYSKTERCTQIIADSSSSECQNSVVISSTDVTHGTSSSYSKKLSSSLSNMDCSSMVQKNSYLSQEDESVLNLNKSEKLAENSANKLPPAADNIPANHSRKVLSSDLIADCVQSKHSLRVLSEVNDLPKYNTDLLCNSSQTDPSPETTDSSQMECISTLSKPVVSSANQAENERQSTTSEAISLSSNLVLQNNVEQTKVPPSMSLVKIPTCVRITPEISGGNRVKLILKGSLNNFAVSNKSTSSSAVVVPFNNCKAVPIKFVALPGKSSALSTRSTSNPSVVEIIGSMSSAPRIPGITHSSPVRLVMSKVPSGKLSTAAMVVKSVVVTGTTASIRLVPSKEPLVSTTSSAFMTSNSQSSISSEVVKTSNNAFLEKKDELHVTNGEIRNNSFESPECDASEQSMTNNHGFSSYKNSFKDSNKHMLNLSFKSDCNKSDINKLKTENSDSDSFNCWPSSNKDVMSLVSSSKDNITNSEALPVSKKYDLLNSGEITTSLNNNISNNDNTCKNSDLLSDFNCKDSEIKPFIKTEIYKNTYSNESSAHNFKNNQPKIRSTEKCEKESFPAEISSELNSSDLNKSRIKPVRPFFNKCDSYEDEIRTIHLVDHENSKQSTTSNIHNERLNSDSISLVVKTKLSESVMYSPKLSKEGLIYAHKKSLGTKKNNSEDQCQGSVGKHQDVHSFLVSENENIACSVSNNCTDTYKLLNDGYLQQTSSHISRGNFKNKNVSNTKENQSFESVELTDVKHEINSPALTISVGDVHNVNKAAFGTAEEFSSVKQQHESEDNCKVKSSDEVS